MAFIGFLFVYLVGGFTFIPLLVSTVLLYAYFTLPTHDETTSSGLQPGDDDVAAVEKAQKDLGEKFKSRPADGMDVAAGYFAVCREYVPGGVNGKPPERTTPAGSTVVQPKSDSVYQSIYRGIFDRKQNNGPLDNKSPGKPPRRSTNVFYVVLRHGHLMLFDDDEQLEVRFVIPLAHHNVSIYNGSERIPEGELWIKRNAICLSRRTDAGDITADGTVSKPFYLFSENCSDKEDFYFALLRNQERSPPSNHNPPIPLQYETKHIINLVQKLHSSEEHLQTRWINALMGRIFLGMYKTSDMEDFFRMKITKKISRVKTPSFLSGITLKRIDMGEGAPYLTNPRLKDLTVDGECVVEGDVKYTGNFRIEVAATARIELGSRFKAREVNLVLAVVLKKLEGHALVRIKPPPSNRIWMSFQTMPKLDMTIEPIVSARQITYTLILRQIENRIKEVFAETLVYPNWDDVPFSSTESKKWRGGIWAPDEDDKVPEPVDLESSAAKEGDVDQLKHLEEPAETIDAQKDHPSVERSMSVPAVEASPPNTLFARKPLKSTVSLKNAKASGSSSSIDARSLKERPKSMRSGSFSIVSPVVSTDTVNVDAYKNTKAIEQSDAASGLAALSARSSPVTTPVGSPSRAPNFAEKAGSIASASSGHSRLSEKSSTNELTPQPTVNIPNIVAESSTTNASPIAESPVDNDTSMESLDTENTRSSETSKSLGKSPRQDTSSSSSSTKSNDPDKLVALERRPVLSAVTSAAISAKRWGLNALQRHSETLAANREQADSNGRPDTSVPMGRGRPLPPPGMPLPPPDRKTKTAPIPVPKRKPVAAPPTLPLNKAGKSTETLLETERANKDSPPPLPKRRPEGLDIGHRSGSGDTEGMLVVAAPLVDSEPTTPLENKDKGNNYLQPQVEDEEDEDLPMSGFSSFKSNDGREAMPEGRNSEEESRDIDARPRLPKRRPGRGVGSPSSDDEDLGMSESLPGWMKAQEEESRKKSMWVDDDGGYP